MPKLFVCVVCGLALCACAPTPKPQPVTTTTTTAVTATTTTSTTVVPVPTTLPTTTTRVVPKVAPTKPTTTTTTEPSETVVITVDLANDADIAAWVAIGRCEQPGDGWQGINWSHQGPRYQGGLGMYSGTFWGYGGNLLGIRNAGDATIEEQIWVARRVRDAHGYSAWGCGRKLGL